MVWILPQTGQKDYRPQTQSGGYVCETVDVVEKENAECSHQQTN